MSQGDASLKEIERQAYRATFEDGIYDIVSGLLFLIFCLIPIFQSIGISRFVGYALLVIPAIVPLLGKQYITIPRLGRVEFGQKRKQKAHITLIIAAVVLFLTLPLLFVISGGHMSGAFGWRLMAVFVAPFLLLTVFLADFPRLYIYAPLAMFSVLVNEFLLGYVESPLNALYSFGLPGTIITAFGVYLLFRFIRTHPLTETEYAG